MTEHPSATPRRYLAVWLPLLPAERLLRARGCGLRDDPPLVLTATVKNATRIAAAGPCALELGLAPGLSLADARARAPRLEAVEHDPEADERLLGRIAADCGRWTPLVGLDPPLGLVLDIAGCAHLFGGEAEMRGRIADRLESAGFTVRSAIAGTPEAARALARFGAGGIVPPGGETEAVCDLPALALEPGGDVALALKRAGLKTIADLARRPRAPLTARFGAALTGRLHRVLGRVDGKFTPLRPVPDCRVEQAFAEPASTQEVIERALHGLIDRASLILEERGAGGRAFEATFFRADGVVRRVRVSAGRPVRGPQIRDLFAEKLDALADPLDPGFGFDLLELSVPRAERLEAAQPELDGAEREEGEFADLIDRLTARFGAGRVLRLAASDTHDPERESTLRPASEPTGAFVWRRTAPGEPPARPLRLFDPPQPVETLAEIPDGPPLRFRWRRVLHEVAKSEGPERISAEWWRSPGGAPAPTRDYFRVEDTQGRRFWLFRAGLYGRETDAPQWRLHGLFP